MRYVAMLLLFNTIAVADEDGGAALPTVHEVTATERNQIEGGCLSQKTSLDYVKRHAPGRPEVQKYQRAYDQCAERAAAQIEYLRTHGTASEQWQRQQAEKRAAEQAAEGQQQAADQARIDAIHNDPKRMSIVFGASFCAMKALRDTSMAEITKEKKYARIGGYESKAKIYALEQRIRYADEKTAELKNHLAGWKGRVKPAACSVPLVQHILACRSSDGRACDQELRDFNSFVPDDPESENGDE